MSEMQFTVERDIPPPGIVHSELVATLRSLEVGASVFVEGKTSRDVRSFIRAARRGADTFFQSQTKTTGVRIWRLE